MEDDIDIYEDLPSFGIKCDETFESNDEQQNRKILSERSELQKQIGELTAKLEKLQKLNENLEMNLFSLLKTAKAEIARKDKMIDELRTRLDDAAFKRGLFCKANQSVIDKSTFCETIVNKHHKSSSLSSCLPRSNDPSPTMDPTGDRAKDQPNKSSLNPVTLFGERLLKRVVLDAQNAEAKDRSSNRHMIVSNESRNTNNCTPESDKENGSVNDTGFPNTTREPETLPATRYNGGSEYAKNPPTRSRSTSKDVQSQRTSAHVRNYAAKRPHRDEDGHYSAKRTKIDGPVRRDECGNGVVESKSRSPSCSSTVRLASLEFSSDVCEKKSHSFRDPSTTCSRDSKNDAARGKRNPLEYSSKRHDRSSAQNSAFTVDERSTDDRGIEFHKRIVFRASYTETRRTRQRDHQRNDDHRSRTKSTSYGKYVREVKYSRYSNYDERYEDRYDFRGNDADKAGQQSKTDSCNSLHRGTIKRSTVDRASRVSKRSGSSTDHPYPTARIAAEKSKKRSRRLEEGDQGSVEERATKRPRVPVSRTKSREPTIPKVEPDLPSGVQLSHDTATDLEDGEIVNTPDNSPQKSVDRAEPREERDAETVVDALEETKLPSPTIDGTVDPRERVAFEAVENAENVEDIEKFIRDSASTREKEREVATVSQDSAPTSGANDIETATPATCDSATRTERTGDLSSSDTSEEDAAVHGLAVPPPETRATATDGSMPDSIAVSETREIEEENDGPDSTNPEHGNDGLAIGTTNGKACDNRARSGLEIEGASRSPRDLGNSRDVTANVQGKIVVFARRKKAVRLTNSNADMTVLISKEDRVGCP